MTTKIALSNIQDAVVTAITPTVPKITGISVTNSSYTVLDDTAVSIAGGYIRITGTGFTAGSQVLIGSVAATSVSFVSSTELRAQLPATSAGTYVVYVVATDGSVAIRVNGITFSSTPTWSTGSTLTSGSTNVPISIQLAATSDTTVTYALAAGSTLPSGLSLSSSGVLSGTITGISVDTTYNFTVNAIDAENQDSPRAFSITITVVLQVARSLRFNAADTTYLQRTNTVAGNRRTFTLSFWIKRVTTASHTFFGASQNTQGYRDQIFFYADGRMRIDIYNNVVRPSDGNLIQQETLEAFNDFSAWYHVVIAVDTTQASNTNGVKIYKNGVLCTLQNNAYTQNAEASINNNLEQTWGWLPVYTPQKSNMYLANVYMVDGQQLTPTSFGETDPDTGVWRPKQYTGTYGTNGYYLNFSDNSNTTAATLGKDSSGNNNNFTPYNFSVAAGVGNDSVVDSPTSYGTDTGLGGEVRGNYCTMNPLDNSGMTLSNGNLSGSHTGNTGGVRGSIGVSSGKWYWEMTISAVGSSGQGNLLVGIATNTVPLADNTNANLWVYWGGNGNKFNTSMTAYGATFGNGDVIGIAFDADAGSITFYKNNVSQGVAFSSIPAGTYLPWFNTGGGGATYSTSWDVNFGQRPFAYTAPSGFKALCSQNLPTPAIGATSTTQANKYFNTVLYTGNGNNTQSITVGFQPDFIWTKSRSNAYFHVLFDAVRGRGMLSTNNNNAEVAATSTVYELTSYDSNGFTLGPDYSLSVNPNGSSMVAWNWNAGGSTVTNTQGTITSQVRANTTAGFSIVSYSAGAANATVGHGLGAIPAFIIVKNRSSASNDWAVYHSALGKDIVIVLSSSAAQVSLSNYWGTSNLTTTTFGLANAGYSNNTGNLIAYCWAPVAGFSSFGSYVGNGSTTGPFIYTGFRPRFIMLKIASGAAYNADQWFMFDTARGTYNDNNPYLFANSSNTEGAFTAPEIFSNGFYINTNSNALNYSASTYIYAAFAETPFKYARAR